ncbi:GNAT family N-acetyltransferase [Algisphaera agarilytica]|uniref:Ribosomal protein S18 acetylase RimI-like enzyme n=1 Tax=Algisphaera agarilytica TaxID=1385975 RepID=A0A7X0LMJ2_9BACT|nr:GNAT family N-acetyltransferase [Algisphaera agarilytica]MBB6431686.1 ribosomal protein S18 acetylase RimI-like enzyme [Algisphaera agarilytica]
MADQFRQSDVGQSFDYSTLNVRTFVADDQSEVLRLYNDGLLAGQIAPNDTGADLDHVAEAYFDEPRHHFWVAQVAEQIVGMIGVGSDEEHTAEVRRLRVDPAHQDGPVAEQLLESALNHCKNNGYLKIRLDTRYEKTAALGHFDRIGFQHTRTRTAPGKEVLEFYLDLYRQHEDQPDGTPTS